MLSRLWPTIQTYQQHPNTLPTTHAFISWGTRKQRGLECLRILSHSHRDSTTKQLLVFRSKFSLSARNTQTTQPNPKNTWFPTHPLSTPCVHSETIAVPEVLYQHSVCSTNAPAYQSLPYTTYSIPTTNTPQHSTYITGPWPPFASSTTISSPINSRLRVLFTFPSQYLFAIGLSLIFSLRCSLPPTLCCTPKQHDSLGYTPNSDIHNNNPRGFHPLWRRFPAGLPCSCAYL